jgi:hypothetical protein
MTESRFEQELSITTDGRPFLTHTSRTWLVDDDGRRLRPGAAESGFWRPGAGERDVELVLAHPSGVVEMYYGEVVFRKVELATDHVATTATAKRVNGSTRLYGMVDEDLAYAVDLAAVDQPLQPHFSALLKRPA